MRQEFFYSHLKKPEKKIKSENFMLTEKNNIFWPQHMNNKTVLNQKTKSPGVCERCATKLKRS